MRNNHGGVLLLVGGVLCIKYDQRLLHITADHPEIRLA